MNQVLAVETWNNKFRVGSEVDVEGKKFRGRTITPACLRDGEAKVYVDGLVGPVPLRMVRPLAGVTREVL
jgi:hypothetical protein